MGFKKLKAHRSSLVIDKEKILEWYGSYLENVSSISYQIDGKSNDVISVDYSGGKVYLKFYNDCFENRAETEIFVREQYGSFFPFPKVLFKDFSQKYVPRNVLCFEQAHGRILDSIIHEEELSSLLNVLDVASKIQSKNFGLVTPHGLDQLGFSDYWLFISEVVDAAAKRNSCVKDIFPIYYDLASRVTLSEPSFTHQSFNHKHLFVKDKAISGIIDLESVAFSDKHIDLASLYLSFEEIHAEKIIKDRILQYAREKADFDSFRFFAFRQVLLDLGFKHGLSESHLLTLLEKIRKGDFS